MTIPYILIEVILLKHLSKSLRSLEDQPLTAYDSLHTSDFFTKAAQYLWRCL